MTGSGQIAGDGTLAVVAAIAAKKKPLVVVIVGVANLAAHIPVRLADNVVVDTPVDKVVEVASAVAAAAEAPLWVVVWNWHVVFRNVAVGLI